MVLVTSDARAPIGAVFGGGGLFGIGYALGVVEGLSNFGVTFAGSPMLGTSAGSWAAAAVSLGIDVQELLSMPVPSFPNPKSGVLAAAARSIFGDARSSFVKVCACALPRLRRTVFDGDKYPLADLVAASSAVPGLLAPHEIDGVRYVDGGMRSGTSVDFGPEVDQLYVVAPLAGAMWGPFRNVIDRGMHREIARWKERCQGNVTLYTPVEVAADIAKNPRHLFDKSRAVEAYYCGVEQVRSDGIKV